ncbi:MAG: hypothetical protein HZA60_00235 [Deltaproteobacteria bacterium]|nr:hypothetical protein [Deltaproteobacteria bacterium]
MNASAPGREGRVADSGYQARFLLSLAFVYLCGAFLLFLAFFLILMRPLPGAYAAVFFALRDLSALLLPVIVISVLAHTLIVGLAAVFLCGYALHKVAGPLYHVERVLEGFGTGDPLKAVFLREGDQLEPLAAAYNTFMARLREDRQKWTALMVHADRLCLQDTAVCREEMGNALAELSILLSKYR